MSLFTRSTDITAALACYRFLQQGVAGDLRVQAGLSQLEVARDLGVDVATLERWERGESLPVGHRATAYGHALQAIDVRLREATSARTAG